MGTKFITHKPLLAAINVFRKRKMCQSSPRHCYLNHDHTTSILSPSLHTIHTHTHTHTRLTALFPGLPGWAGTRKVKPIWILLKQETASGSGISWAVCKSAPRSRQITMPAPHHSVFYRPDALPAAQPTASKHWRQPPYHSKHLNLLMSDQQYSLNKK